MALSKDILKTNILVAFENNKANPGLDVSPLMSPEVATELAIAYHKYASSAMAAGATISVPGEISVITNSLSSTPSFMGWGKGLLAYWTSIMFAGPGFIPVNPTIPIAVIGCDVDISSILPPNKLSESEDDFAEKLATILDTYTKKIIVTLTTVSVPPIVTPTNIS